jgi:hypothetical protein
VVKKFQDKGSKRKEGKKVVCNYNEGKTFSIKDINHLWSSSYNEDGISEKRDDSEKKELPR